MVRGRALSFLMGGQRSSGVIGGQMPGNLVNTISQVRKVGWISYLIWRRVMVRGRPLSFLVGFKGHLGS